MFLIINTDNAAMIAHAAHFKLSLNQFDKMDLLMPKPKWSLNEL